MKKTIVFKVISLFFFPLAVILAILGSEINHPELYPFALLFWLADMAVRFIELAKLIRERKAKDSEIKGESK